jgi:hypothetical protein
MAAAALLLPVASADAATTLSSNWAGYVVTPKRSGTKFKTVSGTWVVPQGNCRSGSSGYSATWVGIGGYRSSSQALEQTGTAFDCTADGTARYSAWYELVPDVSHDLSITVQPGDTIDAAVTVKRTRVTVYLRNRTRGVVFRRTFTMSKPDTSTAEWIVEAPASCNGAGQCAQLPISDFGTISFTRASATSARGERGSISSSRWSRTKVTLSQGGGRFARFASARGAEPSSLSADGTSFSVSYSEQAPSTDTQPPMLYPGAGGV